MATKSRYVNMAGLDLITRSIRVGATKNGQLGTELAGAELLVLDGITAGTATASRAVVLDSNANITGMGVRRAIVEDGVAVVLTPAQSGALCIFDKVDGALYTLPSPIVGLSYDFIVDTASTSVGQKIITSAGTVFIKGTVNAFVTGADADLAADTANGTTHVSVNFNGTTTGGIVGTRVRLTCRSATVWEIEGDAIKSGSVATTFATS